MVLNKDKIRQSLFDVVPRSVEEVKKREEEKAREEGASQPTPAHDRIASAASASRETPAAPVPQAAPVTQSPPPPLAAPSPGAVPGPAREAPRESSSRGGGVVLTPSPTPRASAPGDPAGPPAPAGGPAGSLHPTLIREPPVWARTTPRDAPADPSGPGDAGAPSRSAPGPVDTPVSPTRPGPGPERSGVAGPSPSGTRAPAAPGLAGEPVTQPPRVDATAWDMGEIERSPADDREDGSDRSEPGGAFSSPVEPDRPGPSGAGTSLAPPAGDVPAPAPAARPGPGPAGRSRAEPGPVSRFLDPTVFKPRIEDIPNGFVHIVHQYICGNFFSNFLRLFVVCKRCHQRLELSEPRVTCLGCGMQAPSEEMAAQVMMVVAAELYSSDRVRRELRWIQEMKLEHRGIDTRPLVQDLGQVLTEGYVCIFAHELLKNVIQKSEAVLLDFFRKYIDRIEVGRESIRLLVK